MDIGFVVYPRLTVLDLAGPWHVMSSVPGATCHAVWNRSGPIMAEGGLELVTTISFNDCPPLDLVVVPGGPGQQSLMRHVPLIEFLRDRAGSTRWIAGVASGVLLLGQAGLLRGRRATTVPALARGLGAFGATVVEEPFVIDGTIATCAGWGPAIEMSLALVAALAGEEAASAVREVTA